MKSKSQLHQYRGPLTAQQIADGMAAAQRNALRLIEDAKMLLAARRFASATALAILAIEECGKVPILNRPALLSDPADQKSVWREYRLHRAKNAQWILPELVNGGARVLTDLAAATDAEADHAWVLEDLKQVSLYTDCLGHRHWSVPGEVIGEDIATAIIERAEAIEFRTVSPRQVELWMELVGPHYDKPTMIEAVLRWQAAMVAEGLSDTPTERLEAFMRGKPVGVSSSSF